MSEQLEPLMSRSSRSDWACWLRKRDVQLHELDDDDEKNLEVITRPFFLKNAIDFDVIIVADGCVTKGVNGGKPKIGFGMVVYLRTTKSTYFFCGEVKIPPKADHKRIVQHGEFLPLITALENATSRDKLCLFTDQQALVKYLDKSLKLDAAATELVVNGSDTVATASVTSVVDVEKKKKFATTLCELVLKNVQKPAEAHLEWTKSKNGNRPHTVCDILARVGTGGNILDHFDEKANNEKTKDEAMRRSLAHWIKRSNLRKWDKTLWDFNRDSHKELVSFSKNLVAYGDQMKRKHPETSTDN